MKAPFEIFSSKLFWDIHPENLEWGKSKKTIVVRVLERGSIEDWKNLMKIYGLDEIVKVLKDVRSLTPKDLNFIAKISKKPLTYFRCYNLKFLNQQHWSY